MHVQKKGLLALAIVVVLLGIAFIVMNGISNQNRQQTSDQSPVPTEVVKLHGALVKGFPAPFPVYPGAVLEESSSMNQLADTQKGYRAEWKIHKALSASEVMEWYLDAFRKNNFRIIKYPTDQNATGEQVAQVSKDELLIYFEVSNHQDSTEIEAFIPQKPK